MADRYIQRLKSAASHYTGSHAGLGVDSDDDRLYVNATGTRRKLAHEFGLALTAATTLTVEQSGGTFFLDAAGGFAVTLPSPSIGLTYEAIVKTAPSGGAYTVVSASSANIIKGQVYTTDVNSATDADFETSGGDTVSLVQSKAVAGDRLVFKCDGTNWFVYGFCSAFDAITITTAS